MSNDHTIFAGLEFSGGRKPVTIAALDDDLNVESVEKLGVSEALPSLQAYGDIWMALNKPLRDQPAYQDLKKQLGPSGFRAYPVSNVSRQYLLTNAQDCFRALIGHKPLPGRTLEGRLQRSAVLYEQGLQLTDPVEVFEEITRFRLVQGILPRDKIYSSGQLDALMAAYLAWMAVNRPGQIVRKGELALPAPE